MGSLSSENLLIHVNRGARGTKTARTGRINFSIIEVFGIAHARCNAPSFRSSKYNCVITFLLTQQIVCRVCYVHRSSLSEDAA